MPITVEAAAVSVRLRRLWLGEIASSPHLAASDLADAIHDVHLQRLADMLVVVSPYDFGDGDPFGDNLGRQLRERVAKLSGGAVTAVEWTFDPEVKLVRRAKSSDLDIFQPGDPDLEELPETLRKLRNKLPDVSAVARDAVGALRLVAESKHRLWFAAPTAEARDALGRVPGSRGALVTAVQAVQKNEVPLYRVVVDGSYRSKGLLL